MRLPRLDSFFGNGTAFLKSEGFVARLYDMAVMCQPIQQSRCQFGINKHSTPLRERQIGRDNNAGPFVKR